MHNKVCLARALALQMCSFKKLGLIENSECVGIGITGRYNKH